MRRCFPAVLEFADPLFFPAELFPPEEPPIAQLQTAYPTGTTTAHAVTQAHLRRIAAYDQSAPYLKSLITVCDHPRSAAAGTFTSRTAGCPCRSPARAARIYGRIPGTAAAATLAAGNSPRTWATSFTTVMGSRRDANWAIRETPLCVRHRGPPLARHAACETR